MTDLDVNISSTETIDEVTFDIDNALETMGISRLDLLRELFENLLSEYKSRGLDVNTGAIEVNDEFVLGVLNRIIEQHGNRAKIDGSGRNLKSRRPAGSRPRPLDEILFGSNTVHAAAIRAFAGTGHWEKQPERGFAYGLKQKLNDLTILVGLPDSAKAESLWAHLSRGGVKAVKAHYALWGRWYQNGGKPGQTITVDINQFCADLGYAPHSKGGHRKENKQEAVKILEALTTIEMHASFITPSNKGKKDAPIKRLRGPLWQRGLIAEESDQYSDLFGEVREGNPDNWEPLAFSYAPGAWFTNPDYAEYNDAVGKIGAGLLQLANDQDQWAILIGGYLGTIIRANQYRPKRLRIETILSAIDKARGADGRRRKSHYLGKFEGALDRLVQVGVLKSWTPVGIDTTEIDMDDPDAIAGYYAAEIQNKGDWRRELIEVEFPNEQDRQRLETATRRAVTSAKSRMKRRTTPVPTP